MSKTRKLRKVQPRVDAAEAMGLARDHARVRGIDFWQSSVFVLLDEDANQWRCVVRGSSDDIACEIVVRADTCEVLTRNPVRLPVNDVVRAGSSTDACDAFRIARDQVVAQGPDTWSPPFDVSFEPDRGHWRVQSRCMSLGGNADVTIDGRTGRVIAIDWNCM